MSQDHREPVLLGTGLLRLVTLGELPSCSGRSDQAMILLWFSVITGWLLCVWGLLSTWSHEEKEELEAGAPHQGGGEMNEPHLINESCVEPSKAGNRDGAWANLRDIHWCFMKDRENWPLTVIDKNILILWNYPKVCMCYFFSYSSLFSLLLSHPTPLSSTSTPTITNDSGLEPMVEKWLPSLLLL